MEVVYKRARTEALELLVRTRISYGPEGVYHEYVYGSGLQEERDCTPYVGASGRGSEEKRNKPHIAGGDGYGAAFV